jgi:RNA polymerase sigma factor (sigma-70 family)
MTESQTLLAEYAGTGSEAAFREIVTRYIDFVYSAATRMVEGAPHLAEDVTQIVFADLARKAGSLPREVMLGGWLHRHTCYVAANLMRGERRRQTRERLSAEMNATPDHSAANLAQIAPILDDAINRLGIADRTAILLRYFEQRDLRTIGQVLGGNEDAARKRVSRALDKLHAILARHGVTFSAAALGTALSVGRVKAAPSGLAATVAASAVAGAAAGGGASFTLLKIMAMTKLKAGIVGSILAAGLVATLVIQQQAQARLHQDEDTLRQQAGQIAQLKAEQGQIAVPAGGGNLNTPEELTRLRAEAQTLRRETNDLAALREEVRQRQKPPPATAAKSMLQQQAERNDRMDYSRQWMLAFILYADKNEGRFPTNFDTAMSFLRPETKNQAIVAPGQFEIVSQGTVSSVTNPANTILFRERETWPSNGKQARIYAFADGHIEIANSVDGNFDDWESQHIIVKPAR